MKHPIRKISRCAVFFLLSISACSRLALGKIPLNTHNWQCEEMVLKFSENGVATLSRVDDSEATVLRVDYEITEIDPGRHANLRFSDDKFMSPLLGYSPELSKTTTVVYQNKRLLLNYPDAGGLGVVCEPMH